MDRNEQLLNRAIDLLKLFNELSCGWFRYATSAGPMVEIMAMREQINDFLDRVDRQ